MKEKADFVERVKKWLLTDEWTAISIYRDEERILVYVDGELKEEVTRVTSKKTAKKGE